MTLHRMRRRLDIPNLTLPVVVWNAWFAGGFGSAAALTLILMALMVPLVALYWWVMRRRGLMQAA